MSSQCVASVIRRAIADERRIAMYSSGRLPIRSPAVDAGLPTLGTGRYEWRGFLPARRHPQQVDSRSGVILNWNNNSSPASKRVTILFFFMITSC